MSSCWARRWSMRRRNSLFCRGGCGEGGGQIRSRDLALHSAGKFLDSQNTGLRFVFAEEHDGPGHLVGGFEGFLEAEAAVAELDAKAAAAQFARQFKRGRI